MTQRMLAGLLAVPLLGVLWFGALREPLPYVIYSPGITADILGTTEDGTEIITVDGRRDLPRGRAAAVHDRLRHPGASPTSTSSSSSGPGSTRDDAIYPCDVDLRARGDRRVAGGARAPSRW